MASSGLKKFAEEKGLKEQKKFVYGVQNGYMITVSEEGNFKRISVGTAFAENDARKDEITEFIRSTLKKEIYLASLAITPSYVDMKLSNRFGIFDKMAAFLDALTAKLKELGVPGADTCWYCSNSFSAGAADALVIDGAVVNMHSGCIESYNRKLDEVSNEFKSEKKNYGKGAIGAVIGGIIGSIPWVIVYLLGYMVWILGLITGFAAKKGYELMGGRPGKYKVWIVVPIIIICVLLATYAGMMIGINNELRDMDIELTFSELNELALLAFEEDSDFRSGVLKDGFFGLVCALASVYGIFSESKKENRGNIPDVSRLEA